MELDIWAGSYFLRCRKCGHTLCNVDEHFADFWLDANLLSRNELNNKYNKYPKALDYVLELKNVIELSDYEENFIQNRSGII